MWTQTGLPRKTFRLKIKHIFSWQSFSPNANFLRIWKNQLSRTTDSQEAEWLAAVVIAAFLTFLLGSTPSSAPASPLFAAITSRLPLDTNNDCLNISQNQLCETHQNYTDKLRVLKLFVCLYAVIQNILQHKSLQHFFCQSNICVYCAVFQAYSRRGLQYAVVQLTNSGHDVSHDPWER